MQHTRSSSESGSQGRAFPGLPGIVMGLGGLGLLLSACAAPAGGGGAPTRHRAPLPLSPGSSLEEQAPAARRAPAGAVRATRDGERQGTAGQSAPREGDVPDVVISAAQDKLARYRTPYTFGGGRDVLGPEEVRQAGGINAQGLLRRTPSVYFFEESGTDSKPNIAVRGVTSNSEGTGRSANVSLMADGIPLAPAPYGHAGQSLFPFTFERVHAVDIIRGGRTVRYGPNTVSGIINFLTRPIPEEPRLEQDFRADTYGGFSSYTGAGGTWDDLGVWAEAVYKTGDSYRNHTDFTIQNYALKLSYDFTERVRGFLQLDWFDDETDLAGGLSPTEFKRNPEGSQSRMNRFEGDQFRINGRLDWDIDENNRLEVTGYAFGGERTFYLGKDIQYGYVPNNRLDATPRPMTVWALQAQYAHRYDLGGVKGELTVGVRHQQEDVARKVERDNLSGTVTLWADSRFDYRVWSAYVDNSFRYGDLEVVPGVRYEGVDIDAEKKTSSGAASDEKVHKDFVELLPALSVNYRLRKDWAVYGNVQSSFLPPQANHVEISSKRQNLEAQYAWTYEVGTRGRLLDGLFSPDLTLYRIDYEDRIERDPDHANVWWNVGNTRHVGVELALNSDLRALDPGLEGLEVNGALSYNHSEFTGGDYENNAVPHAPHWLAQWEVKYNHRESGLWGAVDGFYVGPAYSDADNTGPLNATGTRGRRPSFTVWNVRAGWDTPVADDVRLRLQVGCINVLDEEYFEIRAGQGLFLGAPLGIYSQLGLTVDF